MNIYEKLPCDLINYCTEIDDFRPTQSTLVTRFGLKDCADFWRTTNQDYGAFYYRQRPQTCIPDSLKSKLYQRHNRFQDWLTYQTKCQNLPSTCSMNNNYQTIIPSNRNETVRITHRKRFEPQCQDYTSYQNHFSPCGQAGLITDYIVKKIIEKLQHLIRQDEYPDVIQCIQLLVSEILAQQPSISVNEIINRVITILSTPPVVPCDSSPCPPPSIPLPPTLSSQVPVNTTVSTTGPLNDCQSNVFEKLFQLENAISKLSTSC